MLHELLKLFCIDVTLLKLQPQSLCICTARIKMMIGNEVIIEHPPLLYRGAILIQVQWEELCSQYHGCHFVDFDPSHRHY